MSRPAIDKETIVQAIKQAAESLGKCPSRREFTARSGINENQILSHFESWRDAVRNAGLQPHRAPDPLTEDQLLRDWADVVRELRRIPTVQQYRRMGGHSPETFMRRFGPWVDMPGRFRTYAAGNAVWVDVLALLPPLSIEPTRTPIDEQSDEAPTSPAPQRHRKLEHRPTYGNPIDFRGLRHEPVNENGVVFLFGMVARELGYMVEAVQAGFPDCEAKRQVGTDRWQRVRIEFEFESRNFRDHGHAPDGCDVIVCWRHNWPECPSHLEVVELSSVIRRLAVSEE